MPSVPIKVRCERCGQLIGVPQSKAGGAVHCPRCSAEVHVPRPGAEGPGPADAAERSLSGSGIVASGEDGGEAGVTLDFLEIRPEDLRVRPGDWSYPPPVEPAAPPAPEPEPAIAAPPPPPLATAREVPPPREVATAPVAAPGVAAAEAILPPIRVEPPGTTRGASRRALAGGPRDLVLPRSAVTSWSLLALLAVAFAFLAGLFAGHYVWRVH